MCAYTPLYPSFSFAKRTAAFRSTRIVSACLAAGLRNARSSLISTVGTPDIGGLKPALIGSWLSLRALADTFDVRGGVTTPSPALPRFAGEGAFMPALSVTISCVAGAVCDA